MHSDLRQCVQGAKIDLLAVGLIGIALSVDFGGEEVRSANFIVPVQDLFAQSENVQPFVFWAFLQNAIVEVEAINVNMRSRWFHDTRSFPENGAATTRSDRRACHAPEATWGVFNLKTKDGHSTHRGQGRTISQKMNLPNRGNFAATPSRRSLIHVAAVSKETMPCRHDSNDQQRRK